MINQLTDTQLDYIINHPTVRPTAEGGDYVISSAPLLANPDNFCYGNATGAVLFVGEGQGVYKGHIFCIDGSRGRKAVKLARGALNKLFTDHRALKLVASVPMVLPAARFLCRRAGLKPIGRDELEEHFELEKALWAES